MDWKSQLEVVKKNWLFLAIILVIVFTSSGVGNVFKSSGNYGSYDAGFAVAETATFRTYPPAFDGGDIAPEIEERIKTISSSMSVEIDRGHFDESNDFVMEKIEASDSILINENIYVNGEGVNSQKFGNYQIRVPVDKYENLVEDLKGLGEVVSVSENVDDITSSFLNLEIELAAEEERLVRYNSIYDSAESAEEKLLISDKIFDQERKVLYLKERLKNQGQRVDYATLHFTLSEEASSFAGITVITFKELVRNFVRSFSSLINLIVRLIPYGLAVWMIWLIWKRYLKKANN